MAATPQSTGSDTQLQGLLDQALDGNPAAKEALLNHSCERLLRLTRRMFRGYPGLRRWEETNDIFQNSLVRLHRALAQTEVRDVRHFFNLATVQIRRELIDLSRKHFGPHGIGSNHHTDKQSPDESGGSLHPVSNEPDNVEEWTEFHENVDSLPADEREVFGLIWYEGLEQKEVAKLLDLSKRTVWSRFHRAKLRLAGELVDERQGEETDSR